MLGCNRDTTDALLEHMVLKFRINLLQIPAERLELGEVVIKKDLDSWRCKFEDIFERHLPDISTGDPATVPDIDQLVSAKIGMNVAVRAITQLLHLPLDAGGSVAGKYSGASSIQFRVRDVTKLSCNLGLLSQELRKARIRPDQQLYRDGDNLLVVSAVYFAKTIETIAHGSGTSRLDLELKVHELASGTSSVDVEKSGKSSLTYHRKAPLAFGIELLALVRDQPGWRLSDGAKAVPGVRGPGEDVGLGDLLGDEKDGLVFVELSQFNKAS